MKALCFYNNDEMDKRHFTMLGLSSTADDDKAIGFFGTGFKYAIAAMLRNKAHIHVFSNGDEYYFYVKSGTFRDQEHDFIQVQDINNEKEYELPFTTHLGANWAPWQVYRELYTNALDEGGGVKVLDNLSDADNIKGVRIVIMGSDELLDVHEQHDKYFLKAETITETRTMRAIEREQHHDNVVYYKTMYTGSKVDKETYFTYDYKSHQQLTEDRTLAHMWYLRQHITELWLHMPYDLLIEHLPKLGRDKYYESGLEADHYDPPDDFNRAVKYLIDHHRSLPMWARDTYVRTRPFDEQVTTYKPTKYEQKLLERALDVLTHHKIMIDRDRVIPVVSLPDDILGMCRDDNMYIAKECFAQGFNKILGTVLEEWLHYDKGFEDMTRKMQNALIDMCAIYMDHIYTAECDE